MPFLADDRRHVDDASRAACAHVWHGEAAGVEDTVQIDGEHAVPCVDRIVLDRHDRSVDAGVVHEYVDMTERLERGGERGLDRTRVGKIDSLHKGRERLAACFER